MKYCLLIACLCSSLLALSNKKVKVTVNWTFEHVVDGYDHENKMVVMVDGKLYGESKSFKQTERATFTISVPKGKHAITIQDYAFYNGVWEPHTKANEYSVDAFYDGVIDCRKGTTITMTFDIDRETADISIQSNNKEKEAVPLIVAWQYLHVIDGYDHDNRMLVYVDGKLAATSAVFRESKKGTVTVDVPFGSHDILIENYAYYEGNWELHSRQNDYSIDAFYTANLAFTKKKRRITMMCNITTESSKVTVK